MEMGTPERIVAQIICGVTIILLLTDSGLLGNSHVQSTKRALLFFSFLSSLFSLPLPLLFPERTCTSIKAFQTPYLPGTLPKVANVILDHWSAAKLIA